MAIVEQGQTTTPGEARTEPVRIGGVFGSVRRFVRMFARAFYQEWFEVEVTALASQIAYSLLLAIPSLILITMLFAALIDRHFDVPIADRAIELIDRNSPPSVNDLLTSIVEQAVRRVDTNRISVGLVTALLFGLWSGSGGVNALMNASNRAYGLRETRRYHRRRIRSIILTLTTAVLIVFSLLLFILSRTAGQEIADKVHLGGTFNWVWAHLRWPVIVGLLVGATVGLYQFGPVWRPPLRYTFPGAFLASGLWLVGLAGINTYLSFVNPGSAYGATGSVIILLLFLYFTGVAFILGAMVNGILFRHFCADQHVPELWR